MSTQTLYKNTINYQHKQIERQHALLKTQKQRRLEQQDLNRQLDTLIKSFTKKKYYHHRERTLREIYKYSFKLQQSEWMRVCPEHLNDWFLVPCPRGERCMVIACNERTEVYNKAGKYRMKLKTLLPGSNIGLKYMTILDCIYVHNMDTFYVLDVLSFGQQDLIDCEADFRFFWLRSKLEELKELSTRSSANEKPFQLIETYDCGNADQIDVALQRYPLWLHQQPELDGFLFYHKHSSYTMGVTPLVLWLFPFMVNDVVGWNVSREYVKPFNYTTPEAFMDDFDRKLRKNQNLRRSKRNAMVFKRIEVEHPNEQEQMDDDDDRELNKMLDQERCLELGEMDEDELPKIPVKDVTINI